MEPLDALKKLGGVARTHQLQRLGCSLDMLLEAVEIGTIVRPRKGVYALKEDRPWITAALHGGALACVSALSHRGVWLLEPPPPHVDVGFYGRKHHHDNCRCIDHHVASRPVFGVVSTKRALLTAWRCLSLELFFVAYESARNLGLISEADRDEIIATVPKAIARWLRRARGDAGSGLESLFRFRLMMLGIDLESQVHIDGVGRVDFRYADVLFEIDGREHHDTDPAFHRDRVRDGAAIRAGYRTVRLDYAMIVHEWPATLAIVRSAIATAA